MGKQPAEDYAIRSLTATTVLSGNSNNTVFSPRTQVWTPIAARSKIRASHFKHQEMSGKWRRMFAEAGVNCRLDEPRPHTQVLNDLDLERVFATLLESIPEDATHWSKPSAGTASTVRVMISMVQRYTNVGRTNLMVTGVRLALMILVLGDAAAAQPNSEIKPSCVKRVLFLGNSYTYFNDLPAILSELAKAGHQCIVETRMVAPGGKTLKDHWESSLSHEALNSQTWDFVVLQDQSTLGKNIYFEGNTRVGGDDLFRPYAERWATEIRKHHATPIFYLTWARRATPEDQLALTYAYMSAARATHSLVAPVGLAWAKVRQGAPTIDLYYRDGSHPSPAGSYLAACSIYATIFGKSPANLPAHISGQPVNLETEKLEPDKIAVLVDLPPAVALTLQHAAWDEWQELRGHRGYLNVNPAPLLSVELPSGEPLKPADLEGTWRGQIRFYPGAGPTEMVLRLKWDGQKWKGHLDINYSVKDFTAESLDLADLSVGPSDFSFSDPSSAGVNKFKIVFRGVKSGAELRGKAETNVKGKLEGGRDYELLVLGDWVLHREP